MPRLQSLVGLSEDGGARAHAGDSHLVSQCNGLMSVAYDVQTAGHEIGMGCWIYEFEHTTWILHHTKIGDQRVHFQGGY
jgi:hypothetical protein